MIIYYTNADDKQILTEQSKRIQLWTHESYKM